MSISTDYLPGKIHNLINVTALLMMHGVAACRIRKMNQDQMNNPWKGGKVNKKRIMPINLCL